MNKVTKIIQLLFCTACLVGCAGFVGGDLANVDVNYRLSSCHNSQKPYEIMVKTEAEHDYADKNLSGYLSTFTLGLIPTYWLSFISNEVQIINNKNILYSRQDDSRIHKFYGILWLFVLDGKSVNALKSDEGAGIRIPEGVKSRAIAKTLNELPEGVKVEELCIKNT